MHTRSGCRLLVRYCISVSSLRVAGIVAVGFLGASAAVSLAGVQWQQAHLSARLLHPSHCYVLSAASLCYRGTWIERQTHQNAQTCACQAAAWHTQLLAGAS